MTMDEALELVTPEFHENWCRAARSVRPNQIPPTLSQMKVVLSILNVDDVLGIVLQFDPPEVAVDPSTSDGSEAQGEVKS